jgi:hypothetical protein
MRPNVAGTVSSASVRLAELAAARRSLTLDSRPPRPALTAAALRRLTALSRTISSVHQQGTSLRMNTALLNLHTFIARQE